MRFLLKLNGEEIGEETDVSSIEVLSSSEELVVNLVVKQQASSDEQVLDTILENFEAEQIVDAMPVKEATKTVSSPVLPFKEDDSSSTHQFVTKNGMNPTEEVEAGLVINKPGKAGILIQKEELHAGQKFPIGEDVIQILAGTRKDLSVKLVSKLTSEKFKNLKKNIFLKSPTFVALGDSETRIAIQQLVVQEQNHTRAIDRENYLFIELPPVLVIEKIDNEAKGEGAFHYEEMISVYENPLSFSQMKISPAEV